MDELNGLTLPDFPILANNRVGGIFIRRALRTFHAAARHIRDLPYGRNTDRGDYRLVLTEGRGTCSTKHALLAALAEEHGISVRLTMGIYLMSEANTPGVGVALQSRGIDAVPEAHCYLMYERRRFDLTSPGTELAPKLDFIHEETITPDQIGAYKTAIHLRYIETWAQESGLCAADVWAARKACIGALSKAGAADSAQRARHVSSAPTRWPWAPR